MIWLFIGVAFMAVVTLAALMASRPVTVLYALALVVSLVGINIHIGATIYLSRIMLFLFLLALIVRSAVGRRGGFQLECLSRFISVFPLILLVQLIAVLSSSRVSDGLRIMFIYMNVMAIFITVVIVGTRSEFIIKAIKFYLVTGLVQGVYGLYQVIGGNMGMNWPTYQTFMAGISTANDQSIGGYSYAGSYGLFRAAGFFPADVSHYAGYMAGVLLIAMGLVAHKRRKILPYLVIVAGLMGLLLSLSRSGIAAFILIGIPSLLFVRWRAHLTASHAWRHVTILLSLVIMGSVIMSQFVGDSANIDFPRVFDALSSRFSDVIDPGVSEAGSMEGHIITRLLAIDAWMSSPLFGVGLGVNASHWYSERYQTVWGGAHSHHFDILGQTGLLGACLEWYFMLIVGLYMWHGLKASCRDSEERNILAGILAAYITILLGNFFYYYYLNDFVWFLMGCGVALSRSIIQETRTEAFMKTAISAENPNYAW